MGASGHCELVALHHDYMEDDLAIVVYYYPVDTLEELQEFRSQYSVMYGAQSTPTCFIINK